MSAPDSFMDGDLQLEAGAPPGGPDSFSSAGNPLFFRYYAEGGTATCAASKALINSPSCLAVSSASHCKRSAMR